MLARPLFREKHRPDMSDIEAEALLNEALRVSMYECACFSGVQPWRCVLESLHQG